MVEERTLRLYVGLVALGTFLLALACSSNDPVSTAPLKPASLDTYSYVVGKVTAAGVNPESPIEEASVEIYHMVGKWPPVKHVLWSGYTDENGDYASVDLGTYAGTKAQFYVHKEGYLPYETEITIPTNVALVKNVALWEE